MNTFFRRGTLVVSLLRLSLPETDADVDPSWFCFFQKRRPSHHFGHDNQSQTRSRRDAHDDISLSPLSFFPRADARARIKEREKERERKKNSSPLRLLSWSPSSSSSKGNQHHARRELFSFSFPSKRRQKKRKKKVLIV